MNAQVNSFQGWQIPSPVCWRLSTNPENHAEFLAAGLFLSLLGTVQVLLLSKKPGINETKMSNYRCEMIHFKVLKIKERLILVKTTSDVDANLILLQPAFQHGHSNETALLHILNGIYYFDDSNWSQHLKRHWRGRLHMVVCWMEKKLGTCSKISMRLFSCSTIRLQFAKMSLSTTKSHRVLYSV